MKVRAKCVLFAATAPLVMLLGIGCGSSMAPSGANVDDASARLVVKVDTITPNEGPAAGSTRVTIIGGPYEDQIGVLFGRYAAVDPIVVNSRMITAFAPAQDPGVVDLTVITDAGQVTVLGAFTYTAPPQNVVAAVTDPTHVDIISIAPALGSIDGGTLVTIEGENFSPETVVKFGEIVAETITVLNSQILTAITPPHEGGAVDVQVLSEGTKDALAGGFLYTDGTMVDDGTDTDGDGLTDVQEMTGWEVWIENFGLQLGTDTFGNVDRSSVTSDPSLTDTDGDGLDDNVEMLIRCDPRKLDSDNDGLQDGEEWNQWLTSPTSVDTDADARGDRNLQNAPNQALFDGMELFDAAVLRLPQGDPLRVIRARATSPTLADTDGDGVSDYDEFDSTVRNGVLADLPLLNFELVGDVDVRLNVEYAEAIGESTEYGFTLTETDTETIASGFSATVGFEVQTAVTAAYEAGAVNAGVEITAGIHGEFTTTFSRETSHEASTENSKLTSDSREFTETAADGAIRTAILLENGGNTTFTVNGLGVLVSQTEKKKAKGDESPARGVKTIATMTPVFDTFTLAPGETAGPFELAAEGVNADAIKELLVAPDSLILGTAAMNFTDSSGLDFDFVREFTAAQTAIISIDFGDSREPVRTYNVATNVDRNPDSSYRGITLRRVLEDVLRLPYGDPVHGYTTRIASSGYQFIDSLLDRGYVPGPECPRSYWGVVVNSVDLLDTDFNDIVLHAGDGVALFFSRDDDGDCLSNTLEKAFGTDQQGEGASPDDDADNDGLTNKFEVIEGWIAFENPADPGAPHPDGFEKTRVFSSPTAADTDEDGLPDAQEYAARSDPNDPDSDGDELRDGVDPFPTRKAATRFVKAGATVGGNGRSWASAYRTIQQALTDAATGQATPLDPNDDVSQIWVASGVYKPSLRSNPIALVKGVRIYGGFSGGSPGVDAETKRGQRNSNPFSNGCVITGDLGGDDTGAITLTIPPTTINDNCPVVVSAPYSVSRDTLLDGFMITGAYARTSDLNASFGGGALNLEGSPTIQNCLITRNANQNSGGGVVTRNFITGGPAPLQGTGTPVFKNCIIAGNVANRGGGAFINSAPSPNEGVFADYVSVIFENCEFSQNEARTIGANDLVSVGGGVAIVSPTIPNTNPPLTPSSVVDFVRCAFTGNQAWSRGGGISARGGTTQQGVSYGAPYVRADACRFYGNSTTGAACRCVGQFIGGGIDLDGDGSVSNSVFWDNRAYNYGAGIAVVNGDGSGVTPHRVAITNCTLAYNRNTYPSWGGGIYARGSLSNVAIENTIAVQNYFGTGAIPDFDADDAPQEVHQIHNAWDDIAAPMTVRNSAFNGNYITTYSNRNNNINSDPMLKDLALGDLSLEAQSPCVDRGNNVVDLEPAVPGFQQLPEFDLFGNPRIADGNGDGVTTVDIGAFEAPKSK